MEEAEFYTRETCRTWEVEINLCASVGNDIESVVFVICIQNVHMSLALCSSDLQCFRIGIHVCRKESALECRAPNREQVSFLSGVITMFEMDSAVCLTDEYALSEIYSFEAVTSDVAMDALFVFFNRIAT